MLKDNKTKKQVYKQKVLKKRKELIFPLYFGLEIVIRRVSDLKQHIVGPFKKYWQYVTTVIVLIVMVSTVFFINNYYNTKAATYNFVQTDWSGGSSTTTTAVHTSNQSGWTKFYSSTGVDTSGGELKLERD